MKIHAETKISFTIDEHEIKSILDSDTQLSMLARIIDSKIAKQLSAIYGEALEKLNECKRSE